MIRLVSVPIAAATARERVGQSSVRAVLGLCAVSGFLRGKLEGRGDASAGLTSFFLLCLAFALGTALVAEELESGHAQLVLLRPLTRVAWLGGRIAGAVLVLAGGVVLAWLAALTGALLARAGGSPQAPLPARSLLALGPPLQLLALSGWVCVLAAVSVVARGWTNLAAVLLAILGWFAVRSALAFAAPRAAEVARALGPYLHPRDAVPLALQLAAGDRPDLGPLAWDLVFFALAFCAGCLLLRGVELARRRA